MGGAAHAQGQEKATCSGLIALGVPKGAVLFAEPVDAGAFTASDGKTYRDLTPFCRVVADLKPDPQSNIIVEVWLPEAASWNGKLLGTGNGGFAGEIRSAALAGGLRRGFVTSNTDMGTYPAGSIGYSAGIGRPQIVKDWGYRSTHEMTVLSKSLIAHYYGRPQRRSYFAGCSTGGHQALTEAQRFPDDYDAILAGAPGNNRTHLHASFLQIALSLRPQGALVSSADAETLHAAVLKSCAGLDGGAPGDLYLTNPALCRFDLHAFACPRAGDANCLPPEEIATWTALYDGVRNPRTQHLIYPGRVRGSELEAGRWLTRRQDSVSADLTAWVFGASHDVWRFDFDKDMAVIDEAIGADVNALDSDLTRFAAHGGKLILYHGWSDMVVTPLDTLQYYDRVVETMANRREGGAINFMRLFMAPGMSHCAGGSGPDAFGQSGEAAFSPSGPVRSSADTDLLLALDRWVETGKAPEQVVATKYAQSDAQKVLETRPLCAYPATARYKGVGDPTTASSFVCAAAPTASFERSAPEYLR